MNPASSRLVTFATLALVIAGTVPVWAAPSASKAPPRSRSFENPVLRVEVQGKGRIRMLLIPGLTCHGRRHGARPSPTSPPGTNAMP